MYMSSTPPSGRTRSALTKRWPVADPEPVPLPARLLERRGAPALGETLAPRRHDLSEPDRDDHEHERALEHRADDARDGHAGGPDHGELRRHGQGSQPDEGADHRGKRKQDEGMSRKSEEHELDRPADAVASPADRVELLDEAHDRGERQEHRKREQRAPRDMPGDPGVEDLHGDAPGPPRGRAERSFMPRRRPPGVWLRRSARTARAMAACTGHAPTRAGTIPRSTRFSAMLIALV